MRKLWSEPHRLDSLGGQDKYPMMGCFLTPEEVARELKRLREEQAQLLAQYPRNRIQLFWLEHGPLVIGLSILVVAATLIVTAFC